MFMHAETRPLWPAIALVPWLVFGIGCLLYAARRKLRELRTPARSRAFRLHVISLAGLALFAASRVVLGDPVVAQARACEAATPREARPLADTLYERGEYQRAGECYQVAGDLARANLAFLKAAGPTSEDTARDLKVQRDAAKALFAGVAQAFRRSR